MQYTINAKDTTYAAGNGITISGANNEISVKVKAGENNLQVTDAGLELKKDLTVDSVAVPLCLLQVLVMAIRHTSPAAV